MGSPVSVTLSDRDLKNTTELMKTLHVRKPASVVSSSLNMAARLNRMVRGGNKLYIKDGTGSIRKVSITSYGTGRDDD